MFDKFFSNVKAFFHGKTILSSWSAAKADVATVTPYATALLDVLHTLGLVGDHVTAIVTKVVAVANDAASTGLTGPDKLKLVAADVGQIAATAGLPDLASKANIVAQIGYELAKDHGLLPAA